jgi:N-acetyl-anhydromuramyl-L-alanine amidase AmpD
VLKDGTVIAHYPDEAQTWHAGSAYNNSTIGLEHEGGLSPTNEPLTPAQLAASVALVRWLSARHGFPMTLRTGMWEHNWVSGEPTACPSGRIPWAQYTKEDDVPTQQEWDQHLAEFRALYKFSTDVRDALYGLTRFVLRDKGEDDAEAKAILARLDALERK